MASVRSGSAILGSSYRKVIRPMPESDKKSSFFLIGGKKTPKDDTASETKPEFSNMGVVGHDRIEIMGEGIGGQGRTKKGGRGGSVMTGNLPHHILGPYKGVLTKRKHCYSAGRRGW